MPPRPALARTVLALAVLSLLPAVAHGEDPKPAPPPAAPPVPAPPPSAVPERGRVGFQPLTVRALTPDQRAGLGLTRESGAVVVVVVPGGPAAKAGLVVGDVLLKYRGKEVPDDSDIDGPETARAWALAFAKLAEGTRAGEAVEIVVERDGKPVTLTAVAIGDAEMKALEAGGKAPAKPGALPALSSAGDPAAYSQSFDDVPAPGLPQGFFPASGRWRVVGADATPGGKPNWVLRQDELMNPWAVLLVAGKGLAYADGTASVRFQPVSGEEDASGGVVFRAQDAQNYYFARANALEGNFRLYLVKDGVRSTLASVEVKAPEMGKWHTIEVTFNGPAFQATLNGKDVVEAKNETFASGWAGLWTKADSVTQFDDWKTAPAAKPAAPTK